MGRIAENVPESDPSDHELTWLAANWHKLPLDVKTAILTIAGSVLSGSDGSSDPIA